MAKRETPSFDRSAGEALCPGKAGPTNHVADFVKSTEEEVKRLVLAGHALTRPGHFDPQEAMRVKFELDGLFLNLQRAKQAAVTEYFDWLGANIPELLSNKGRPHWIQSHKVMVQDQALLKAFDDTLARNVAAKGKKHRASQKTYSDLADKYGDNNEETVKQRVMRARRRQKALRETIQDIQDILRNAALGETDRPKVTTPKEYERRREKLLQAFRRVLKLK